MDIILLHTDVESKRSYYQIKDTVLVENYPTNCGIGSKAIIIDPDGVDKPIYKRFDGTIWNLL